MCGFWMMYELIYVLCEVAIVSQLSLSHFCSRLNNASDSIKQGAPKSGMALITNL